MFSKLPSLSRFVFASRACKVNSLASSSRRSFSSNAGDPVRKLDIENASSPHGNFTVDKLRILPRPDPQSIPKEIGGFGTLCSDHMLEVSFKGGEWDVPTIRGVEDLKLHPFAKVLHYSTTIFEGLKAFRGPDGKIRLFRMDKNMERMRSSAKRAALPDFDPTQLALMIEELVRTEKDWVPDDLGTSLYIRPFLMGTDPYLGVSTPKEARLCVVCSPVGPYYATGWKPVTLFADSAHIRAAPGGVGSYKMGCNYAPTIAIADHAAEQGAQQVLWLWGEKQWLTEAGTMNVFIFWKTPEGELELVTPPLTDGLILPGVTRDSILTLAKEWGEFKVSERYPTMDEIAAANREGRLLEMFGAGTAAVVAPVSTIIHNTKSGVTRIEIPDRKQEDQLFRRIHSAINDIQYGLADRPDWIRIVN